MANQLDTAVVDKRAVVIDAAITIVLSTNKTGSSRKTKGSKMKWRIQGLSCARRCCSRCQEKPLRSSSIKTKPKNGYDAAKNLNLTGPCRGPDLEVELTLRTYYSSIYFKRL